MKKIKKSLAMLLAVLMLASFTPLFASAATQVTCNKTNCVLVEAPKYKVAGADDSTAVKDIVLPYNADGYTWASLEVVGGKISYNGVEVAGHFETNSTYLSRALTIGNNSPRLQFIPDDTENFKKASWTSTTTSPLTDWPTVTVEGLPASISEVPTVGVCASGNRLSTVTITGGNVVNGEGIDVTAEGTWSFVKATTIPSESGNFELQWKSSSYSTLKTTVYVEVKTIGTTLAEKPVYKYTLYGSSANWSVNFSNSYLKDSAGNQTGKILDEDGNDVTQKGSWAFVDLPNMYVYRTTDVKVRWSGTGYAPVETTMTLEVVNPLETNLYMTKKPTIDAPDEYYWKEGTTAFNICEITSPGEVVDDNGNVVEGRWETYVLNVASTEIKMQQSNTFYVRFIPADTRFKTMGVNGVSDTCTIKRGSVYIDDDFLVVLNYGQIYSSELRYNTSNPTATYNNDLRFSNRTLKDGLSATFVMFTDPDFDPSVLDYGTLVYVEAKVGCDDTYHYESTVQTIPVKIQPYTMTTIFCDNAFNYSAFVLDGPYGIENESDNGLVRVKLDFTNKRLKGDVVITAVCGENTYDVATVSPDADGKFYYEEKWHAPENGQYTMYFTYVASEDDVAVFSDENLKTIKSEFEVNARNKYTLTVKVGTQSFTREVFEGRSDTFNIVEEYGMNIEGYETWKITDGNGKEVTLVNNRPSNEITKVTSWFIMEEMPGHDVVITAVDALGQTGENGEEISDGGFLDSFLAFWNKIVNFIVTIYQMMYDMFKF